MANDRHREPERRAACSSVPHDTNLAAPGFDELTADKEPQSGPAGFGRMERLKQQRNRVLSHAGAIVLDLDLHESTEVDRRNRNGRRRAILGCIARIAEQVGQDPPQLGESDSDMNLRQWFAQDNVGLAPSQ